MNTLDELVPPRPVLPESILELRTAIRSFLEDCRQTERFESACDGWIFGFDRRFSRELGRRGWTGLVIPTDHGGPARGPLERYVIAEELLAAGAPVAAHWTAERQTAPALLRFGSTGQRDRFLPRIVRGDLAVAVAMSEPDSGSDLASVRTSARSVPDGFVLNGRKVWTSHAHRADILVVLARTEPADRTRRHDGLSQFIVECPSDGLEVRPLHGLDGLHHFNEVLFDDVHVPAENLLGTPGAGWTQVTAELTSERSGPDRFLSTYPLLTALHSVASGSDDTLTADRMGELIARLWVLRQLSLSVAGAQESGRDATIAAALVKDLDTRFERDVVDVTTRAWPVALDGALPPHIARHLNPAADNAPGYTLRGGANEILRGVVARAVGSR